MSHIFIHHAHALNFSPPFAFVLRGYADLVDKGWGPAELPFGNATPVLWIEEADGVIAAASVYYTDASRRLAYSLFTVTHKDYRNRGYRTLLMNETKRRVKLEGADHLLTSTHPDNRTVMQVPDGRRPLAVRFLIDLE